MPASKTCVASHPGKSSRTREESLSMCSLQREIIELALLGVRAQVADQFQVGIALGTAAPAFQGQVVPHNDQRLAGAGKRDVEPTPIAEEAQPALFVRAHRGVENDIAVAALERIDGGDLNRERLPELAGRDNFRLEFDNLRVIRRDDGNFLVLAALPVATLHTVEELGDALD